MRARFLWSAVAVLAAAALSAGCSKVQEQDATLETVGSGPTRRSGRWWTRSCKAGTWAGRPGASR